MPAAGAVQGRAERQCVVYRAEPVLPIGQRPAAIRTFYQPGKNLRRTILALSAAVCYLLLYLPENLFADNRLPVSYTHLAIVAIGKRDG